MQKLLFPALFGLFLTVFAACDKEETVTIDSAKPDTFTKTRSGSLTAQNGTPTAGTAELGTDKSGAQWLHLGSDFKTELGTGTATVYLSKGDTYLADPGNGNPTLILAGVIASNGEMYYKLSKTAGADYTHVIIWCGSASIPFGNAKLQ